MPNVVPNSASRAPDKATDALEPPLTGHEYDGIREYDNPMPRWWVLMFWGSFFFSVGYYFHYHVSPNGISVQAGYEADVRQFQEAEAKNSLAEPVSEASLSKLMNDATSMSEAKTLFSQRCSPCHGASGEGSIGPNLTDHHWMHEHGELAEIYQIVNVGIPEKGMPPWGRQLSPVELRKVAAFVGTLRGTNVAGKPPQGSLVSR
jgi:cytochrome c oxidase cbb3-type subunit 3